MAKTEKIAFILEQVRLCLERKDFIRAHILSKKISTRAFVERKGEGQGDIGIEGSTIEAPDAVGGSCGDGVLGEPGCWGSRGAAVLLGLLPAGPVAGGAAWQGLAGPAAAGAALQPVETPPPDASARRSPLPPPPPPPPRRASPACRSSSWCTTS
jgi:hypothetical protein